MWSDDDEVTSVVGGENVKIKLKGGIEEEDVLPGFVLCEANNLCTVGKVFDAQVSLSNLNFLWDLCFLKKEFMLLKIDGHIEKKTIYWAFR